MLSSTQQIELRSIDQIPDAERHGRVRDQFTLWFGNNANIFPVIVGGVAVLLGLSFPWACVAIVTGVAVGLSLVGLHAVQGPMLGVPQMIQSRGQFGFYGAVLVFAASIVLDFGFLAAQLVIQAEAMNLLFKSVSMVAWILILTVPVIWLTVFGYDWIHRWERWMTVVLAVTFGIVAIRAFAHGTPTGDVAGWHPPGFALFVGAVSLMVISMVSWAPYVSDYSRYLPRSVSRTKLFWSVVLGCAIPAIFCATLGAYITSLMPGQDSIVALRDIAGSWVLPVMALSLIGSDAANAYTGMLALAGILSCFRPVGASIPVRVMGSLLVIGAGLFFALIGYQHFIENLSNFLNVLLYVFIPWSAINLTDYYLVRRAQYDVPSFFTPEGRYGSFQWPGLIAYVLAVVLQIPFIDQAFYTGPLVDRLGGTDISWLVGGMAGVLIYLFALRLSPPKDAAVESAVVI